MQTLNNKPTQGESSNAYHRAGGK